MTHYGAEIMTVDITFCNEPRLDHIACPDARKMALEQHYEFERDLETQHEGLLHEAVASKRHVLRQQIVFLITKYCKKSKVCLDVLSETITRANGDCDEPGLFTMSNGKTIVNLHILDDTTLYRVYLQIPEQHRICGVGQVVEETFKWVCCDACFKWRRIASEFEAPSYWSCSMHPRGATCADPEDKMEEGETTNP